MQVKDKEHQFRGDIELLRGAAVILVVLFHLKIGLIKSGFIGVDIFFVISGFLMAAALNEPTKQAILLFYERRARRVLPAALAVFFLFFIAAPFLFLPFETEKVAKSFLGTLFLSPNIVFWLQNSYFDEFTFRPMLHYWSLGVEFQYYLIFPVLVYFFRDKQIFYIMCFGLSLLLSLYLTNFSSKTAFFLLPTRIWEFFFGFYAFRLSKLNIVQSFRWGAHVACVSLIVMISVAFLEIPQDKFPGFYAIIPAFFAFLYITFGLHTLDKYYFFPLALIRYLGKISYSIYLIHYPIIFLFIYAPFSEWRPLTTINAFAAVVITLILSFLSHKYLESPFRNRALIPLGVFVKIMLSVIISAFLLLLVFMQSNNFTRLYPPAEQRVFYAVDDQGEWRCSYMEKIKSRGARSCVLLNVVNPVKKLLLVGDSHMDAIKYLFVEKAQARPANIRLMTESCLLGTGACTTENLLNEALRFGITDIVLHGAFSHKFNYSELDSLIAQAPVNNIKIHFIDPVPTYPKSVPKVLYGVATKKETLSAYIYTRDDFLSKRNQAYHQFKATHLAEANVAFYDPSEYLCSLFCEIQGDSGIYYHDSHHLSLTGAKLLYPIADKIFEK